MAKTQFLSKNPKRLYKAVVCDDEESMEDGEQYQVETWMQLNLIDFI